MERGVLDCYIHQITEGIISNIAVTEGKTVNQQDTEKRNMRYP
jgi:hypothetical protein